MTISAKPKAPGKTASAKPGKATQASARSTGGRAQARHREAAQMVRDLQNRAEALLANADRLLDRLS